MPRASGPARRVWLAGLTPERVAFKAAVAAESLGFLGGVMLLAVETRRRRRANFKWEMSAHGKAGRGITSHGWAGPHPQVQTPERLAADTPTPAFCGP